MEKQGAVSYTTEQENEPSETFITLSLANWIQLESTAQSPAGCTLEYGLLNQPITDKVTSILNGLVALMTAAFPTISHLPDAV